VTDARSFLAGLVGKPCGQSVSIARTGSFESRATRSSWRPVDRLKGSRLSIAWVQAAIDALERDRVICIDVPTVWTSQRVHRRSA